LAVGVHGLNFIGRAAAGCRKFCRSLRPAATGQWLWRFSATSFALVFSSRIATNPLGGYPALLAMTARTQPLNLERLRMIRVMTVNPQRHIDSSAAGAGVRLRDAAMFHGVTDGFAGCVILRPLVALLSSVPLHAANLS
jgi:hypothetical protein